MAIVGYKSRPRMRSWTAPEPPPPPKSRFLLLAFAVWSLALYVGFHLAWPQGYRFFESEEANGSNAALRDEVLSAKQEEMRVAPEAPRASFEGVSPGTADPPKPAEVADRGSTKPGEIAACEAFLEEAKNRENERMPTHLGRSAMIEFVGSAEWAKPCRGRKRRTVQFCAAIRDGIIVGLTIKGRPHDLSLETCVREEAMKLTLPQEPTLRIVDAILTI